MNENERLLTARDLAPMFGVKAATIYKWTKTGLLPHFKVGCSLRFRKSDLEQALFVPEKNDKKIGVEEVICP